MSEIADRSVSQDRANDFITAHQDSRWRPTKLKFNLVVLSLLLSSLPSCGDIKRNSTFITSGTQVGDVFIATRGDEVVRISNEESMPNAFGGADIFGRTRSTGMTYLIFLGGDEDTANFLRRDVDIQSNKTTMNSTPLFIPRSSQSTFSGSFGNIPYSGTSNTYGAPFILPPDSPEDQVAGVRETVIAVPPVHGKNTLLIGGKILTILSVTQNEVRYRMQ